jgi:hypothetical protein
MDGATLSAFEIDGGNKPRLTFCSAAMQSARTGNGKGQGFDWIGELTRRPQNERYCFRNFGVGGAQPNLHLRPRDQQSRAAQ